MKRQRLKNLIATIATITVFGFTLGLLFPLLSLTMKRHGIDEETIGYMTAIASVGVIASLFLTPVLVKKFGAKITVITATLIASLLVLVYPYVPILWWWLPLRMFHGFVVSIIFSISEAWVVKFAEGKYRSRVIAIYSSVMAISFGAGPALLSVTGIDTPLPFYIGALIIALAILPLTLVRDSDATIDEADEAPLSVLQFAAKAPALLLGVTLFAIIDTANLSFLPVYGVTLGQTEAAAALSLTFFIIGNTILQFPLGWLADHMNKSHLMLACILITGITSAFLPLTFNTWLYWPELMILGAASSSIYTLCLSQLGDQFTGHELVTGTASFATSWGLGAFVGSLIAGYAMKHYGPNGLPFSMSLVYIAGFCLLLFYQKTRSKTKIVKKS